MKKLRSNRARVAGRIQAMLVKREQRNYLNLFRSYITHLLMVRKYQRNENRDLCLQYSKKVTELKEKFTEEL